MHLAAGLVAGTAIGIMCITGLTLAFESELVAWAERDSRGVTPPASNHPRLPLSDLVLKVRAAQPEAPLALLTVSADPKVAVAFPLGREGVAYANPYTGDIRYEPAVRTRSFLRMATDWHRYLARSGDARPVGKAINGACNLAFLVLALSGIYLWLPRTWSWRGVKAVALINRRLAGKARDFNWHNVIGLWSAPILIVLTLTAVPISYRWGTNLVYRLAGEEPPVQGERGAGFPPAPAGPKPAEGKPVLDYDALLSRVQILTPDWELITLPLNAGPGGRSGVQPVRVTVKIPRSWPRTATTTLTLDPYTGSELKRENFADLSAGRQIRTWTRFLHTGQALGRPGQLVAGLGCLGGCFLVYTGFALAWRRFFGKKDSLAT